MELADRIKKVRTHFGLSQTEFAQKLNLSTGFVSGVETGRSGVSLETIKTICASFGVNEDWLISGIGEMGCGDAVDKTDVGKRIKALRKENHLTQDELAEKVGYSKKHVYCVETNKIKPSNDLIRKVSYIFSVNYTWLLTGTGSREIEEVEISEKLISWLKKNPDVVKELEIRSGVE